MVEKEKMKGQKRCPECTKFVIPLYHQIQGIALLDDIDGKLCYRVKCPECGCEWSIKKRK